MGEGRPLSRCAVPCAQAASDRDPPPRGASAARGGRRGRRRSGEREDIRAPTTNSSVCSAEGQSAADVTAAKVAAVYTADRELAPLRANDATATNAIDTRRDNDARAKLERTVSAETATASASLRPDPPAGLGTSLDRRGAAAQRDLRRELAPAASHRPERARAEPLAPVARLAAPPQRTKRLSAALTAPVAGGTARRRRRSCW